MEKRGICAHVTHGFAVFPEAKAEGENQKRVSYGTHNTTCYHGVTNLYYTEHVQYRHKKVWIVYSCLKQRKVSYICNPHYLCTNQYSINKSVATIIFGLTAI